MEKLPDHSNPRTRRLVLVTDAVAVLGSVILIRLLTPSDGGWLEAILGSIILISGFHLTVGLWRAWTARRH